jgi:polysaccharide biosynthesis transport protein
MNNFNNPLQEQQLSLKDIDFKYYFNHYLRLFWKWKWYSLVAGPTAGAIAVFAILQIGLLKNPPLPATVYIGIDSPKTRLYNDYGGGSQNKERLLSSRSFVESVVKKLSLQVLISGYTRSELFDSLQIDSTTPLGSFNFILDKENHDIYQILFTNKSLNIKNKVIQSGTTSTLKHLSFSGISLIFSESFLKDPHNFSFSTIPMRYAIDRIIGKLKVTSPNPREETYFYSATLEGADYPLVAQTINTMADFFIQNNISMQKQVIKETIIELEKQLAAADQVQAQSKSELKSFLAKNPGAGLSQSTQQTMTELISLESGSYESNNLVEEAQSLKVKFNNAPSEEKLQVVNEMIVFLQTHGSLAAPALQANLAQFTQEKTAALQNYAKTHPIFAEIDGKFASLNSRAIQAIDSYINQIKKSLTDRTSSIQKITSKLQGLPSQELQFAELQKRQDIDSDIYSKLLAKYNEAKVSETVRGSDLFIMEYAIQPIAPSRLLQYAKSAGIIFSAILLFAFGPAVSLDFFDKTAKSEQTLTKMLPYRFLETIPLVKMPTIGNQSQNIKGEPTAHVGEILINLPGIEPPSAVELFRSLTTKILLDFYEVTDRSIVVTSYEMDEGKSTVAANLAISLAQQGVKTVLIDCDLRRGVAHKILSLNKNPGLSEYLINICQSAHPSSVALPLQQTAISNLWAIPSGTIDENPQRLLSSPALASLKQRLLQESFFVIMDSPPVAITADSAMLSNLTSKYVLVVRAGRTNVVSLRKILVKDYPMIDKKILGVVLNMGENTVPTRYYSYYYDNTRKRPRSS